MKLEVLEGGRPANKLPNIRIVCVRLPLESGFWSGATKMRRLYDCCILLVLVLCASVVLCGAQGTATIYVNCSAPAGGTGSPQDPFSSLQRALDAVTALGTSYAAIDVTVEGSECEIGESLLLSSLVPVRIVGDASERPTVQCSCASSECDFGYAIRADNLTSLTLSGLAFASCPALVTSRQEVGLSLDSALYLESVFIDGSVTAALRLTNVWDVVLVACEARNLAAVLLAHTSGSDRDASLLVQDSNFLDVGRGLEVTSYSEVEVRNSSFSGMDAVVLGGARGRWVVAGSSFTSTSEGYGGGVYGAGFHSNSSDVILRIEKSSFIACRAVQGGAVYLSGGQLEVSGCYFGNNAAQRGGSVAIAAATATFEASSFFGNNAELDVGGAMYLTEGATVTVAGCFFDMNFAPAGSVFGCLSRKEVVVYEVEEDDDWDLYNEEGLSYFLDNKQPMDACTSEYFDGIEAQTHGLLALLVALAIVVAGVMAVVVVLGLMWKRSSSLFPDMGVSNEEEEEGGGEQEMEEVNVGHYDLPVVSEEESSLAVPELDEEEAIA